MLCVKQTKNFIIEDTKNEDTSDSWYPLPPISPVPTDDSREHDIYIFCWRASRHHCSRKRILQSQAVDVELIHKQYPQLEQANFNAAKYDGITSSLGNFIILSATNPDIQSVIVIDESIGADVVVAQSKIKTVADLKGKKLGANLGGFSEVFVLKC